MHKLLVVTNNMSGLEDGAFSPVMGVPACTLKHPMQAWAAGCGLCKHMAGLRTSILHMRLLYNNAVVEKCPDQLNDRNMPRLAEFNAAVLFHLSYSFCSSG